jgi:hypothetical protein
MPSLTPIDYDPFATPAPSNGGGKLTPVDYDPFAQLPVAGNEAEVRAAEKASGMTPEPMSQWEHFKRGLGMILEDPSLLAQVGPGRIPGQIASGAQLPADVAAGKVAMGLPSDLPPETMERVNDLAMFVNPGALSGTPARSVGTPTLSPGQVAANTAERAGMELPTVSYMPQMVQKAAAALSDAPIVGAPLQKMADAKRAEAGERIQGLAESVGTASPEGAGARIQEGIKTYKKDVIPDIEKRVYAPINEGIPPDMRFQPSNTLDALEAAQSRLGESAGKLGGETARVQRALEQGEGQLSFQALMDLRSALGAEMRAPLKREGYDESVATRLYVTLSDDIREAARTAGGDALARKWDAANDTTRNAIQQFKAVRGLAADNVSPEQAAERVFRLAMERSGSAGQMQKLKSTIGDEGWSDVSATAIDRLGRKPDGELSFNTFVTNYGKMSPGSRNVLFGEANRAVGDLAATFQKLQELDRFKSKSQSANVTAGGLGLTGLWVEPFTTAMTGIGGYLGAKWLASPRSANSVASWAKAYTSYVQRPTESVKRALSERADTTARVIAAETGFESPNLIAEQLKGILDPSAVAAPLQFNVDQEKAR